VRRERPRELSEFTPLRELLERQRRVRRGTRLALLAVAGLVLATGAAIAAIVAAI